MGNNPLRIALALSVFFALALLLIPKTSYALDNCIVPNGADYNIAEHSTCKIITNSHASGDGGCPGGFGPPVITSCAP